MFKCQWEGKHFFEVSADDLAPVLSNGMSSITGCPQGGELTAGAYPGFDEGGFG